MTPSSLLALYIKNKGEKIVVIVLFIKNSLITVLKRDKLVGETIFYQLRLFTK